MGIVSAMVVPGNAILATGNVAGPAGIDTDGRPTDTPEGVIEVNGKDHEGIDMARPDTDGKEADDRRSSTDGDKEWSKPWPV